MNFNFLLATANATATAIPSSNFDWRPIIYSIILCIITAIVQWWFGWRKGASRRDTNHFIAFMDESAEFREEIRKDRNRLKSELEEIIIDKNYFKEKYAECSKIVNQHSFELSEAQREIRLAQAEIVALHAKLSNY